MSQLFIQLVFNKQKQEPSPRFLLLSQMAHQLPNSLQLMSISSRFVSNHSVVVAEIILLSWSRTTQAFDHAPYRGCRHFYNIRDVSVMFVLCRNL